MCRYITHRTSMALAFATAWLSTGCGALPKHASASASPASGSANAAGANSSLANLEVLAPGELATKIYNAFGPGMTMTQTVSKNGQTGPQIDYLEANASDFIGSISNDPSNEYASSFSIGYFLALAGLAQVVGTNYAAAAQQGGITNDCTQTAGATSILQAIAPAMPSDQADTYAAQIVTACSGDRVSGVSAVVQSYAMALKTTI